MCVCEYALVPRARQWTRARQAVAWRPLARVAIETVPTASASVALRVVLAVLQEETIKKQSSFKTDTKTRCGDAFRVGSNVIFLSGAVFQTDSARLTRQRPVEGSQSLECPLQLQP